MILEVYEVFVVSVVSGLAVFLATITIGFLWRRFMKRGK